MHKKIGAITLNWNGKKFIIPHLKMLTQGGVDRHVVIQGTSPWSDYANEYQLSEKPDSSEKLIKKYFPDIPIIPACKNVFGADIYNQGLDYLADCDIVLRLDYDMFLTNEDWSKLISIIQDNDKECFLLDFEFNTVNYYGDFDHGVKNAKEGDPIAVSPLNHFFEIPKRLLEYPRDKAIIISNDASWKTSITSDFIIHHFRGWKGYGINKDWLNNKIPNQNGVKINDLLEFNPDHKFIKCPDEIREMLCQKSLF